MYAPAVRVITLVKGNLHPFVSAVFLPNDLLAVIPKNQLSYLTFQAKKFTAPW